MTITRKCLRCKKSFKTYDQRRKYCKEKCQLKPFCNSLRLLPLILFCRQCMKTFEKTARYHEFCSEECRNKYQNKPS